MKSGGGARTDAQHHEAGGRFDLRRRPARVQLHRALPAWEQTAIEQLLSMPTMHVDETSLRVDRKKLWIHVCSAGEITLKFVHPKRGREAIDAIGVIPRYGGVVIHDCWASYLAYGHCGYGLCGSHLLRDLTFIVEANGYAWAVNMKRLLQETCARVSKRKRKKLTEGEYKRLQKRYTTILTRGEKELPPIPPRQNGKSAAESPKPMPIICADAQNSMRRPSCCSLSPPMSLLPITAPSATYT